LGHISLSSKLKSFYSGIAYASRNIQEEDSLAKEVTIERTKKASP
jgi:hypothetical protein